MGMADQLDMQQLEIYDRKAFIEFADQDTQG